MSKNDPAAPNQSNTILQIVRNKNNLEDLTLKRRMIHFHKSLNVKIGDIEQERLDVFDFIKQLKLCESDQMGEFKRLNEDLRQNPPSTSKGSSSYILPLISTKLTSVSEAHPKINGPFTIDTRTVKTAPASLLWKDPNMISLKDLSAKTIDSGLEKTRRSTQLIPEKCLQRLAASGWADALLILQAQNTRKEKKKKRAPQRRKPRDSEDDEELDEEAIKGNKRLELPPTGTVPRVRSELVIPGAIEAEARREMYKIRPSTTEKLKTKQKEIINNPKPKSKEDRVSESESKIETQPDEAEKRAAEEAELDAKRKRRRRNERPGSDILRMILDRKAQKILQNKTNKVPMATRIKTFYDKVEDTSTPPASKLGKTRMSTFLPPI